MPASSSASWTATAPMSKAEVSKRPKGWRPTPMMATSFISHPLRLALARGSEGERQDLVALGVHVERHDRQFDVHAEVELLRVRFRQPRLDADEIVELHEPHSER